MDAPAGPLTPGRTSMAAPLVELQDISRSFGGTRALSRVRLTVRPGEVHCLAGENGCGKSTLIKILAGVLSPDSGQIVLDGIARARLTPAVSQAAGVRIIYQDLSLFPNLTVAENICFHRHVGHAGRLVSARAARGEADAVMDRLGVSLPLDKAVGELPIASRQLVAICRTLATDARLVVMDEPTASLTHKEADALLASIRVLRAQGIATVLVSHRLDDMMRIGDCITVLRDGTNVGSFALAGMDREHLAELITGRRIRRGESMRDRPAPARRRWRFAACPARGEYADIQPGPSARGSPGPDGEAGLGPHRTGI